MIINKIRKRSCGREATRSGVALMYCGENYKLKSNCSKCRLIFSLASANSILLRFYLKKLITSKTSGK